MKRPEKGRFRIKSGHIGNTDTATVECSYNTAERVFAINRMKRSSVCEDDVEVMASDGESRNMRGQHSKIESVKK